MNGSKKQVLAENTEVGSYFVSNYPPFSVWTDSSVSTITNPALTTKPSEVPFGVYLHIPFCRKRCHFCYFRVYTDKNANEIQNYIDLLVREWELYSTQKAIANRPIDFVYFGGGTPSFLSVKQLNTLVDRLGHPTPWSTAKEITFECEPGTLTESKLSAIRNIGVTRLSLGIENFDDRVLEVNGRAHRSAEIYRSYSYARSIEFPQINIDLIAGMLGETEDNWKACIEKTLELAPDSITIYQMELPYNTTISDDFLRGTGRFTESVVSWPMKRRWVAEAFEAFERAGYTIGSAYTAVKDPDITKFVYRDCLWQGADLVGLGVASFGHISGVHMQNLDSWNNYAKAIGENRLPLSRAYKLNKEECLIRELVLQLKLGSIQPSYFKNKYNIDIRDRFSKVWTSLDDNGYLINTDNNIIFLSRDGLLKVDSYLPQFFLAEHRDIRYT